MSTTYSKVKNSQREKVIILAVLVGICLAARLLFMGRHLEWWDSIDFALGLRDYDIIWDKPVMFADSVSK